MDSGVFRDLIPQILARLSPRDRAKCRLLCKQWCALISAGVIAQRFWGYSTYQEFLMMMIRGIRDIYKKWIAEGTWSIEQARVIIIVLYDYVPSLEMYKKYGIVKEHEDSWFEESFCYLPPFLVCGIVENLCTFEDFITGNNKDLMILLFENHIILNLLRKGYSLHYFRALEPDKQMVRAYQNLFTLANAEEILEYCLKNSYNIPKEFANQKLMHVMRIKEGWDAKRIIEFHHNNDIIEDPLYYMMRHSECFLYSFDKAVENLRASILY